MKEWRPGNVTDTDPDPIITDSRGTPGEKKQFNTKFTVEVFSVGNFYSSDGGAREGGRVINRVPRIRRLYETLRD